LYFQKPLEINGPLYRLDTRYGGTTSGGLFLLKCPLLFSSIKRRNSSKSTNSFTKWQGGFIGVWSMDQDGQDACTQVCSWWRRLGKDERRV